MRFAIQPPAVRPGLSWTRSWKRRTCTNTCRSFEKRFQTMPCQICAKCYITLCSQKRMRKGTQASSRLWPPAHAKQVHELASMTYCTCARHSLKNAPDTQVEWLNGACVAYSSNKTSRKPGAQKAIQTLSTEVCGETNKVLGANSFMKGIWKICGCLCSPLAWQHMSVSAVRLQQLLVRCLQGRPSGPYIAATIALVRLRVWLQSLSRVLRARPTTACQVSQPGQGTHPEVNCEDVAARINPDKAPVPTQQIAQDLREIIPLLSAPYMVHRFHANRAMKETSDKVSAFQLEVSGRTEGSHKVRHVLEILSNCSVLQTIGVQLRRDSLRHSPAAELVQKLISNS